ncbi:MAG: Phenylacetic acid catabolic protein [Planctomycetota bacterium]|jgi:1,2-phenylacetyl-CoA epoxidase catalytic subunit
MAEIRTVRSRAEMDQRYYETLIRLLESQGYRELAAATVFAAALHLVPTLRFKKKVVRHIDEEMEHFEVCCELYAEIGAGDLDGVCTAILREKKPIPPIESFLELGVAQFLYDRASAFQLREYENSSFDPYCRIVGRILEEEGHESFGAEILIEHARDPAERGRIQELFHKWLAVALRSFGRPGTPGNRYAAPSASRPATRPRSPRSTSTASRRSCGSRGWPFRAGRSSSGGASRPRPTSICAADVLRSGGLAALWPHRPPRPAARERDRPAGDAREEPRCLSSRS